MKKQLALLSAIVAFLLVVSPIMASAETIPVTALQISDPVVYMNGEPIADMTGLMLQVAGGSTSDESLTQLFVDVFAGDQNVNSAMVQIDDNGLAGYLGGMTSAYGVTKEEMSAMIGESMGVTDLEGLITKLENWTLPSDFFALVNDFAQNGMTYGTPETIEVDLAAGKTNMSYVPISADMTDLMASVFTLVENDPLIGPMLTSLAVDEGYASFSDLFNDAGITCTMSGGIATTEDGTSTMIEENLVMTADGETVNADVNILLDGSMGDTQYMTITENVYPEGSDESVTVTLNATMMGDDVTMDGTLTSNFEDAESNIEANFNLTYASAAGAGAGTDKLDIAFEVPDEASMTMSAYAVEATGETHFEANMKDSETDLTGYLTFTPAEAADPSVIMAGTLDLGMNDGSDTYSVTCPVSLISTTINTDDFYIAPENVIDLTTMTEEQTNAAEQEMGLAIIQTLTKIEAAVPGLEGLTAGMMGMAQQ